MAYVDAIAGGLQDLNLASYLKNGNARWIILTERENPSALGLIYQIYEPVRRVLDRVYPYPLKGGVPVGPEQLLKKREQNPEGNNRDAFDKDD